MKKQKNHLKTKGCFGVTLFGKRVGLMGVFVLFGCLITLVVASNMLFKDLSTREGHGDEDYWIAGSGTFFRYFSEGKLFDPVWENDVWLFHRSEVSHFLFGASIALHGITYEETQIVKSDKVKQDYGRNYVHEKPERFLKKSPELLWAARLPVALLGIGSAVLLWVVIGLYLSLPAAALSVYLLLTNDVFLNLSRQVMTDTMPLFFELLVLLTMVFLMRRKKISYPFLALAAVFSSLSFSFRYTTVHSFIAVNLLFLVLYWSNGRKRFKSTLKAHLFFNTVFAFTFYILDPTLYFHPVSNFKIILETYITAGKTALNTTEAADYFFRDVLAQNLISKILLLLGGGYLSFLTIREIFSKNVSEKTFLFLWLLNTVLFFALGVVVFAPRYFFMLTVTFIILQAVGFHFLVSCFKRIIKFMVKILNKLLDFSSLSRKFFAMIKK